MAKQPNKRRNTESEQTWSPGQVLLNDFEVQQGLGKGGMGKVYLVRSRTTGMEFAVKHALIKDDNNRQSFLSELRTWIDLPEHPHIAACRFFRTIGDEIAIFSEYIGGGTLADWIRERRLTTLEQILDVAIQFAGGLQALHEHGLIHQDVKPGNVLMTPEGIAKVTDFGLARARLRASDGQVHSPTSASGGRSVLVSFGGMTQAYCSPEQAARQPLSCKTDIWSWGVSVLDVFYGQPSCLYGQAAGESLEAYFREETLDEKLPRMPVEMTMLLGKCFLPKPEQRWDSMSEVADVLVQLYQKTCNRAYTKKGPIASPGTHRHAPLHDRRTSKGGGWTEPDLWLRIALKAIGRDPAEAVIPPRSGSRHAQAISDLSVYEEAYRIFERLVASGRNDLQILFGELCIEKAVVHSETGDLVAAASLYDHAIEIYERLLIKGDPPDCRNHLAAAYMNKAAVIGDLGDAQNAIELFDQCIEIRERLVIQERRQEFADDLAAAYMNKAVRVSGLGDNRSAAALCERATEILERLVSKEGRQELADALATAYINTSGVFMARGDYRTAASFVDRALEIRERLAKQGGLQELANLATVYVNKALTVNRLGDRRSALEINNRAIEIYERLVTRDDQRACRDDLATAYMHKAIGLCALGDNEGSLEFFDRAIQLRERLVKQEGMRELSHDLARTYIGKANVLSAIGDYRSAVEIYDGGIEIYQRLVDREGRQELFGDLATFKAYRATTLINVGERTKGLKQAQKAIVNLRAAMARTGRADLQAVLNWLTDVLTEAGHPISTPDS
jgi:serine/threonine protein kinase